MELAGVKSLRWAPCGPVSFIHFSFFPSNTRLICSNKHLCLLASKSIFIYIYIAARVGHSSLLVSDSVILVMGGFVGDTSARSFYKDIWKSTNNGVNWSVVTANPGWSGKSNLSEGIVWFCLPNYGPASTSSFSALTNAVYICLIYTVGRGLFGSLYIPPSSSTPNGVVIIMGGHHNTVNWSTNEIWKSLDNGLNWTQVVTTAARWGGEFL